MAKIDLPEYDKTIMAMNKAMEEKQLKEPLRHYLGMSQIGDECWRKLFYSFRNAEQRIISASGIKAIEDGYLQEDETAKRLRLVPGLELITLGEDEQQIGFELLLGHFRGHIDGMIHGILEAPKTWHVWENKSVNEKKFNDLIKLRNELGEKQALEQWDPTYYGQAQIYMHGMKVERHFLTVSTPGGRDHCSVRTEYKKKFAEDIIVKAQSIIFDNDILPGPLSTKPEFYKCKWCEFNDICHFGAFPLVHCKTCMFSKPVNNSKRYCLHEEANIPENVLNTGCQFQVYNPALIQLPVYKAGDNFCTYKYKDFYICNANISAFPGVEADKHIEIFTSEKLREIKTLDKIIPTNIKKKKSETSKKIKKAWDK